MFNGIYLEYPFVLCFLLLFIIGAKYFKMQMPSLYFPHLQNFMQTPLYGSKLLFCTKWLTICMLLLALASPLKDTPYEAKPKDGYEIALILDASQSMKAQGFDSAHPEKNRFDVVKSIVDDFIQERSHDNLGLVVFGEYSFIASPLTYDANILAKILKELHISMAGKYTALYEALAQGVNLLQMSESTSKIAILLTDGHSTVEVDSIPLEVAIDMAKKEGVRVYPIGIGMSHEYNQKVLIQIAKETGGHAFGASSASELEAVYDKIDRLEKSKIQAQTLSFKEYYYHYPLGLALVSLFIYIYIRNKGLRL